MSGYIGTKSVLLSTTAATVTGNATIGGNLTVDTNTLFVDSTNNRVGVGTGTPTTALDVAGTVTTGGLTVNGNAIATAGALSNRNLIINGDFQVSQRGNYTSAFAPANNTYYLDRWINSINVVTGTLQDIGRKVRLEATSTGSGTFRLLQKVELQTMNKFNGQTVTLSAKVKSNSAQARLGFYADAYLVPTGNATHTGDGTEQTLTAQITVPSSALTIEFDVFIGFQGANAGDNVSIASGDYVEITEVQLEVGDTATPFEVRSYGQELALCQRYFAMWRSNGGAVDFPGIGFGYASSATGHIIGIKTPVTLRATPTVSFTGTLTLTSGSASAGNLSAVNTVYQNGPDGFWVACTNSASGGTNGFGSLLYCLNSTANSFSADAEL